MTEKIELLTERLRLLRFKLTQSMLNGGDLTDEQFEEMEFIKQSIDKLKEEAKNEKE